MTILTAIEIDKALRDNFFFLISQGTKGQRINSETMKNIRESVSEKDFNLFFNLKGVGK
jgi:hypothetical protein